MTPHDPSLTRRQISDRPLEAFDTPTVVIPTLAMPSLAANVAMEARSRERALLTAAHLDPPKLERKGPLTLMLFVEQDVDMAHPFCELVKVAILEGGERHLDRAPRAESLQIFRHLLPRLRPKLIVPSTPRRVREKRVRTVERLVVESRRQRR